MAQETGVKNVWPAVLVLATLLVVGLVWQGIAMANVVRENKGSGNLDLSSFATKEDVKNAINSAAEAKPTEGSVNPEVPVSGAVSGDYMLTKAEYEDQQTEAKALELAMESVNSKDFKKEVFDLLVAYGEDVDSYKDVTEVRVKDSNVDDDEVDFKVVIYYFTDEDEDNKMKAYFDEFTVKVDDLKFKDNFEDAEVDESYLATLVVDKVKEA